jgi:hypothetical protein
VPRRVSLLGVLGVCVAASLITPPIAGAASFRSSVGDRPVELEGGPTSSEGWGLNSVSCTSSSSCNAVGAGVELRWDGSRWTRSTAFGNINRTVQLTATSCVTRRWCLAVGALGNRPFALQWTGGTWIRVTAPLAVGRDSEATSVSCVWARWCTAIVSSSDSAASIDEMWNGVDWRLLPVPSAPGSSEELAAVTCRTTNACEITGIEFEPTNSILAASWNGTSWTGQSVSTPSGQAGPFRVAGLSCASTTFCVATGTDAAGPFSEEWDGSSWLVMPTMPEPPGAWVDLSAVSCTSSAMCVAVGSGSYPHGPPVDAAEFWNGSSWSLDLFGAPRKAVNTVLASVACVGPVSCFAVGLQDTGDQMLAEHWDGAAWISQVLPSLIGSRQTMTTPGSFRNRLVPTFVPTT